MYYYHPAPGKAPRTGAAALVAALAWSAAAAAQEASDAARAEPSKLFTQDAVPVGEGVWQAQTHVSFLRSLRRWEGGGERVRRGRRRDAAVEAALNYGVDDDLDVGFGGGYFWLAEDGEGPESGRGVGDLTVAAKWRILDAEEKRGAVAVVPAVIVPVGEEGDDERLGPGQSCWGLDVRLAVTRDWPGAWTVSADLGFRAAFGDEDESHGIWTADVAVGYQPLSWFQPEVEINYALHLHHGTPDGHAIALSAGLVLPLADWITVRIGLQQGILGQNSDEATVARLSVDWYF